METIVEAEAVALNEGSAVHVKPGALPAGMGSAGVITENRPGAHLPTSFDGEKGESAGKKKRKKHRAGKKKKGKGREIPEASEGVEAAHSKDMNSAFPSTKLSEIRPSVGKGLGVFATQDIKRGTRIMYERPMVLTGQDLMEVPLAFAKLSAEDQDVFLSLHSRPQGAMDTARTSLLRSRPALRSSDKPFSIEEQVKVMAIAETNAFEAGDESAVCPEISRINHSCLPNVHHCWNSTIGAETVHATRDIVKGEEILITYIVICGSRNLRKEQLERYGFQCTCPACDTSTMFGKASGRRRKRLFELDQKLAMHSQMHIFSPLGGDREALNAVKESLKLLKEEGLDNMETTRNYREAAELSASLGNLSAACEWAEKAMTNTGICAGTDYEGYKNDEKVFQDLVARGDAKKGGRKS